MAMGKAASGRTGAFSSARSSLSLRGMPDFQAVLAPHVSEKVSVCFSLLFVDLRLTVPDINGPGAD